VDVVRAALQVARKIVAMVNPHVPRTFGDGNIHTSQIDVLYNHAMPLHTLHRKRGEEPSAAERAIGQSIAEHLVKDGATLQMGIGAIPDAVLSCLGDHKGLGIHSEMFSDGILPLVEKGVITGEHKTLNTGKITGGFAIGSQKLYDFINDNPGVVMLDIAYVNDTGVIARQPKMTAINSAIEVDITGQVVADSIGTRIFSGVGGQSDYIFGAGKCPDGVPILALPSATAKGESRIVPFIKQGGGVVTTRAHVRYIVTEYGIAQLWGKTLQERAKALIGVAHPDHRGMLTQAAKERGLM
jgi:acyl-CoA hydrolase